MIGAMAIASHTLVLCDDTEPSWLSARAIVKSLRVCYKEMGARLLRYDLSEAGLAAITQNFRRRPVRRLVLLPSAEPPLALIEALEARGLRAESYCFHVWGNFTRFSPEWLRLLRLLRGRRLRLVVASRAQQKQLQAFLGKRSRGCVAVCPFPVETPRRRARLHKELRLISVGRISPMKNVDLLVEFLRRFDERHPALAGKWKLTIAGDFDDVIGVFASLPRGEYFARWSSWWDTLPDNFRRKIENTGFLSRSEVLRRMASADLFVSLSTFHDEDFGMAPIEAMQQGTPVLVSDWGGYRDLGAGADKVAVRVTSAGLFLDFAGFERRLLAAFRRRPSREERRSRDKTARAKFSRAAVTRALARLLRDSPPVMKDPEPLLGEHARAVLRSRKGEALYKKLSAEDRLYKRVYRSYWRD